jgi:hypothetical protein
MKLLLFYLTCDERHFTFPHFIKLLNQSKRKNDWVLFILSHSDDQQFYVDELKNVSIQTMIIANIPLPLNYLVKVRTAIHQAEQLNIPYMMKCDNDIFLTPQTLDYMIDNLSVLDGDKHLTLGPTLSSGIPGVEYFMKQYLSHKEQEILKGRFLQSRFEDRDSVEYSVLNKHTSQAALWDKDAYFNHVKSIPHYYKGIHPIRINYDAICYLNTCILNNKDKFFTSTPTGLILDDSSPYLCDSVFCIRTDTYKKIIYDDSLYVDPYDEVPLNKYAWKESMNHVFVENGFGIHIMYNWYHNIGEYEKIFVNDFFKDK